METVKIIIDACTEILVTRINLFGYSISLMQFILYCFVVMCILLILYKSTA